MASISRSGVLIRGVYILVGTEGEGRSLLRLLPPEYGHGRRVDDAPGRLLRAGSKATGRHHAIRERGS
ncbi:hypothetical protein SCMC78_69900 [Streptomyces sp. CMC78]|uniref:Uncharacterized protein n=1 Tax=Streptomyces sp. CMC78 TaxID=3231512 RepID=A0AB33KYV0_9ACTN